MTFANLLQKLIQIETAAAPGDLRAVHALSIEAQELMLKLERHLIDQLEQGSHPMKAA